MAFDLNKNDGSDKTPSDKIPASSKFDLSKGAAEGATEKKSPKSTLWIIGLVGVLIVGGGIWYYSGSGITAVPVASPKEQAGAATDTTVAKAPASQGTEANPVTEKAAVVSTQVPDEKGNVAATSLNNKIPATFGQGSSSFNRLDRSLVKRIVSYLAENPNASVNIDGYASSDGSLAINQTISQARADAFKKYLVSKGITESRIVASGRGIENPVTSNDTGTGRKKNRRVEITIHKSSN